MIAAFQTFLSDRADRKALAPSLTELIRAICEDVGLPTQHVTEDFIENPLGPPNKEGHIPDSPSHPSVRAMRIGRFG